MDDRIIMVSVVRDFSMYGNLVRDNENNKGAEFVVFDNRQSNETITVRYNSFLDSYDYSKDAWFVFLHEDCEVLESLKDALSSVPKDRIYGAIGCDDVYCKALSGLILNSDREGKSLCFLGSPVQGIKDLLTADCCFMAVHSRLVHTYNLLFFLFCFALAFLLRPDRAIEGSLSHPTPSQDMPKI